MNTFEKLLITCALFFVVFVFGIAVTVAFGVEQQIPIDTDVSKLKLRTWDIYAFLWLLFAYRANNSLKRQQWYPEFMCKWKTSKNGKHKYKKIRVKYFRLGSVFLFTVGVYYCWINLIGIRFEDIQQTLIASSIVGVSAQKIIDIVMVQLKKKYPEVHQVLVDGLHSDDDLTVMNKTVIALVTGKGKGTKKQERDKDDVKTHIPPN